MSLNKVILIGNSGKDPEVRYFDSGICVASFSLATTERGYALSNGTQVPERTEWHNVVCKGERAKFVEKWVKKGSSLYIEGKIRYRQYDTKQGEKRYVTEIHADKVEFFSFGCKREDNQRQNTTCQSAQPEPSTHPEPPKEDLPF